MHIDANLNIQHKIIDSVQLLVHDSVIKVFCLTSGLFLLDVGNSQDFLF